MKFLRELLEADHPEQQKVAIYDLFMAHRPGAGSQVSKAVVSIEELDYAATDDDVADELSNEHRLWGLGEVLRDWRNARKALLSKGLYAEAWEEGIIGLSTKGIKSAGDEVKRLRLLELGDEDEDNDEDF